MEPGTIFFNSCECNPCETGEGCLQSSTDVIEVGGYLRAKIELPEDKWPEFQNEAWVQTMIPIVHGGTIRGVFSHRLEDFPDEKLFNGEMSYENGKVFNRHGGYGDHPFVEFTSRRFTKKVFTISESVSGLLRPLQNIVNIFIPNLIPIPKPTPIWSNVNGRHRALYKFQNMFPDQQAILICLRGDAIGASEAVRGVELRSGVVEEDREEVYYAWRRRDVRGGILLNAITYSHNFNVELDITHIDDYVNFYRYGPSQHLFSFHYPGRVDLKTGIVTPDLGTPPYQLDQQQIIDFNRAFDLFGGAIFTTSCPSYPGVISIR